MDFFYNVPIFGIGKPCSANPHLSILKANQIDESYIRSNLKENKLILIRSTPFEVASNLFGKLVDGYGLRYSYDIQMQYVVTLLEGRDEVEGVAVTVNKRGPYQIIQPHCEGDTTSPIEFFGLYCVQNCEMGGENILSLINQSADHSKLRAKEKAILDLGLFNSEKFELQRHHLDAKEVVTEMPNSSRILLEKERGSVIVRPVPLKASRSLICGADLISYWDNVTVHDHAFHRFQHAILKHLNILNSTLGPSYEPYLHIESYSICNPVDTDSGSVAETAQLFSCHVLHKMEAGDFLLFNNRAWTHSVNNWSPEQVRKLNAMYA
jgi:hypothetical protein